MSALPRIDVLSLGGTIAMTGDSAAGVTPTLTGADLVAAVPGIGKVARIEATGFRQLPGAHLGFADLEALAEEIARRAAAGTQGFVITQGTDTIEETAFALDRLLDPAIPVVVTGAMRNPTLPGADGPANLLASVSVAGFPLARGLGTLVVLGDEIHAARYVRKLHALSPAAFGSPLAGPIGWLAEGQVGIGLRPVSIPPLAPASAPAEARVALIRLALGDDGDLIAAATERGYDGIVVEGMGGGHASPGAADAIERAARAIPVVYTSRTGTGRTLTRTYGFTGGELDLVRRGALPGGWLDGLKARVLLTLCLRRGSAMDVIRETFAPWQG